MKILKSRPINAAKAKLEISQRKVLHEPLADIIDILTATTKLKKPVVERYYKNKGNAFLFSRNSVLRHFFNDPDKIPMELFNQNTDLLTILSAHDKTEDVDGTTFNEGDPTVIIAGVVEKADRTQDEIEQNIHEFLFKTAGDPADEYPPIRTIENIDRFTEEDSILLSLK